jgi:hypothetical protein
LKGWLAALCWVLGIEQHLVDEAGDADEDEVETDYECDDEEIADAFRDENIKYVVAAPGSQEGSGVEC